MALKASSSKINQNVEAMNASAKQMNETKNTLTSLTAQMSNAIAEIGGEIDQFKV
ncbi:MAG: hypothetical protein II814_11485 [Treponema sp.]|nr:hypothetical protein [Treponema sp.]